MSKNSFYTSTGPNRFPKPSIRVLIYTDDPQKIREDGIFGIEELRRQLAAHPPAFADIDLRPVISRNSDAAHHADHKIDDVLNSVQNPYHEVWFFGIHQANKPKFKLDFPGGGGPYSELEDHEVASLDNWMTVDPKDNSKGIGVLMIGDHANPRPDEQPISGPDKFCPPGMDHERFYCLGRALGKKVPRAGLLRKWEGPPTHCSEDSFNTLVPPRSQLDPEPQRLILPRFDSQGNPDPRGQPHNVFRGRNGEWVQVLPDHDHEGAVVLPEKFPESTWPRGPRFQPLPRIIAKGTDQRTGRCLNILAAYDGDTVRRGRIVSDSSWHHYLNVNLQSFSASNLGLPAADQIGQYFSNLVVWLAPLATRKAMAHTMFVWLATHPLMLEVVGAGALHIGSLALRLLRQVASDCEIHELLIAACPEPLRQLFENLDFPYEPEASKLPTVEVLLGSVLGKYFEAAALQDGHSVLRAKRLETVINQGFMNGVLTNVRSTVEFACQNIGILSSFGLKSVPPEIVQAFQSLKSLQTVKQPQRTSAMRTLPSTYELIMTVDGDGSETFDLELDQDPSLCQIIEPTGVSFCPVSGWLDPSSSRVPVTGFMLNDSFIHLSFHLQRVRVMMGGPILQNDDLLMRFKAVDPDTNAPGPAIVAINPDVGDTGTGTATNTR